MTIETAFADYPICSLPTIPTGFVDVSWHNDTCPSFECTALGLMLFIDYPDTAQREFPGAARFTLYVTGMGIELLATDDWQAVLDAIATHQQA